jgi:TRAP-type C4-dicarboxylate transport system substrate-binding protein
LRASTRNAVESTTKQVADLRTKGMAVVDNIDKAKFQATLTPVYAEFGKRFGQENIDRIKNYK